MVCSGELPPSKGWTSLAGPIPFPPFTAMSFVAREHIFFAWWRAGRKAHTLARAEDPIANFVKISLYFFQISIPHPPGSFRADEGEYPGL